jgi:hypothetical protein
MRCKQCKELMVLITTLQGNYNLCKTCSNDSIDEWYEKNPHKDGRGLD